MRVFLIFFFLFSHQLFAQELFLTDGHGMNHLRSYVRAIKKHGRLFVVELNQKIPSHLTHYLKPVKLEQLKSYYPKRRKLQGNLRLMRYLQKTTSEDVEEIVTKMSSFSNRKAGTESNKKATQWIAKKLKALNLNVEVDCFKNNYCNVYGFKKGMKFPNHYILVEAHLDDVGHTQAGADDNASGIAGLILMAKNIAPLATNKSFVFFATNGEERGLLGAHHYVRRFQGSEKLKGVDFVLNMDMIGYNKDGVVDIETNNEYEQLANWMSDLVTSYTTLTPRITMPAWGSDHVPFLNKGIASILTIEHWTTKTPCYHSRCDKPETLNYNYASEIIKLNTAACLLKDKQF